MSEDQDHEDEVQKARSDRLLRIYVLIFVTFLIVFFITGYYFL